jgi:hypothetical protein
MLMSAAELAYALANRAEAVCRHYLSNGRKQGQYWLVGDVRNTPGRSMFVRLKGPKSGRGAAGHWRDAASGEHGDLLDVIRESCGLVAFKDIADEARTFLSLPCADLNRAPFSWPSAKQTSSMDSAQRLFALAQPIAGTLAETYLRNRGLSVLHDTDALRFHPDCYYRPDRRDPVETWPALIAAVTDLKGVLTGIQRTWLDPDGFHPTRLGKAPVNAPRRALGCLLGHAVRFGVPDDVMLAGEGIETVLSLRTHLPGMPMAAALSSAHLAGILFPKNLRRLYIARDNDVAGDRAFVTLAARAEQAGIEAIGLMPRLADFNDDIRALQMHEFCARLCAQMEAQDAACFGVFPAKGVTAALSPSG